VTLYKHSSFLLLATISNNFTEPKSKGVCTVVQSETESQYNEPQLIAEILQFSLKLLQTEWLGRRLRNCIRLNLDCCMQLIS